MCTILGVSYSKATAEKASHAYEHLLLHAAIVLNKAEEPEGLPYAACGWVRLLRYGRLAVYHKICVWKELLAYI